MEIASSSVLITGASSGIGLSLTRQFLAKGASVCAFSRRGLPKDVVEAHSNSLLNFIGDVSKSNDMKKCLEEIKKHFGKLSIVVANAGIATFEHLWKTEDHEAERMIQTNLLGVFHTVKQSYPLLQSTKGPRCVIGIHSIAATTVFEGASVYSATKAGTLAMLRSFREEARPDGISVLDVLPGATRTHIWTKDMLEERGEDMMAPDTIARIIIGALEEGRTSHDEITNVEELVIRPWKGNL